MRTVIYKISQTLTAGDLRQLDEAAKLIRNGQTVAFPTETVYGLGANALQSEAVKRIFSAKQRPADNPLIVHVADKSWLSSFAAQPTPLERQLMDEFWPGPLTLVLSALPGAVPLNVTAGLDTVAVRQPAHPIAIAFLSACGVPLAAPSANRSGKPSPTRAEHVIEDLQGAISGLIDGGPTEVGIESTVVQCVNETVYILRPGGITAAQLQKVAGEQHVHHRPNQEDEELNGATNAPRSPGIKYAHYAPLGELIVGHSADSEKLQYWIADKLTEARNTGHKTGVLTFADRTQTYDADLVLCAGSYHRPETVAASIYHCLREFDKYHITYIVAEACSTSGIGEAVMNRLVKAASGKLYELD